jgi:penicillin G amidase
MRLLIVAAACLSAASLSSCDSSDKIAPSITITPSGTGGSVAVSGPTDFAAAVVNTTGEVSWAVTAGTVSPTTGLHVLYTPPPGNATATITASVDRVQAMVSLTVAPAQITDKKIPGLTAPVTVMYDAQDIPHIQCAAAVDCVAVQGYVQARDRWFPMDFIRHVARGHLAEMIGADGLGSDVQLRTLFTTRDGKRVEEELVKAVDPQTLALLDAFVAGVNAYLHELKQSSATTLGGEYTQLPFPLTAGDLADWSREDTLAIARLNQFQLSESLNAETANGVFATTYGPPATTHKDLARFSVWIRAASPASERGHTLSAGPAHAPSSAVPASGRGTRYLKGWAAQLRALEAATAALHDRMRPADATVGSNNWVVSAAKSASGVAMVANDPHLSLQYPPLFHLSTMTSSNAADNLDLTGGSFPGIPGALVGRGAHVGWGVTVVGYDVTDIYTEQFLPQGNCPTAAPCVQFKGAPVATVVAPFSPVRPFLVRIGPGPTGLVDAGNAAVRTAHPTLPAVPAAAIVVPHHGPVIQAPDAAGKAFSVRWTGHEVNTQDLKAFYGLNTATSVDDAVNALKNYAVGAQNFVLADDAGHIAYDPHALVPLRQFADVRLTAPDKLIAPWFPLPGDGSAEWGDNVSNCAAPTGAPASCWTADADLPFGKDPAKGYFFTANADPIGVSDDNNPLAHPPYLSYDWDDSSGFRATRIEQMIEAALTANGKVSADDMAAIQSDHVSRPGMALTPIIHAIPNTGAPAEFASAKAILDQWAANGWDCPSGVVGTDPNGPADTTAAVVQNSAGCFLFHAFLRTLTTNVFADDLKVAGQGINALAAVKAMLFMLAQDPNNPATPALTAFCNDVNAAGTVVTSRTCPEQIVIALVTAFDTLAARLGPDPSKWTWGRVHVIRPVSLLALVTTNYSPGPFARPGGAFTVDVGSPSLSGGGLDFTYGSGGNVRHISLMDPAKPRTRMQLPGPERDGPTFNLGPNLLGQWVKNTYFDYAIGNQINPIAVATQSFKAAP